MGGSLPKKKVPGISICISTAVVSVPSVAAAGRGEAYYCCCRGEAYCSCCCRGEAYCCCRGGLLLLLHG